MSYCLGWKLTDATLARNVLTLSYTECGQSGTIEVDLSGIAVTSTCYLDRLEMGKMGIVSTDPGAIGEQPITPVMTLADSTIVDAMLWLGTAGSTDTIIEIYSLDSLAAGTLLDTVTIAAGDSAAYPVAIIGSVIPQGGGMSMLVTQGSDALDLNVTVWFEVCTDLSPEEPV